ncbi:C39 family peptidase [Bacillus sp. FJAT-18017]|uniref:C39 family peptidase n=1 Tax=Bacillus sp. FJAT-18017 TaxID=1705566 RepID=UPI000ABB792D|nr:C39 family peptidase [Bacillus sp. FJAT-18017]
MRKIYFLTTLLLLHGCESGKSISAVEETRKEVFTSQTPKEQQYDMGKSEAKHGERIDLSGQKGEEVPGATKLDVVQINQNPELRYGCEVTSLAMVLNYAGVKTGKMELYRAIRKDHDPIVRSGRDITNWGNPAEGFVGDMTGKNGAGYAVYDQPIADLVNIYLPGRAVNLTNKPFEDILAHVEKGYPVVVWTTGDYRLPDRWESWMHAGERIRTPLDLHAVVLVGFDTDNVYINDPLSGKKQHRVNKEQFIASWKALKCRAVSYH